jgi:hypothetical protein
MSELNFSDEPIDSQTDFDNWEPAPEFAPPPAAGTYRTYVSEIREAKEFDAKAGKRLNATLDFRIVGGQYDDRAITWQRISNAEFERRDGHRSSMMLDLVKSAGIQQAPRSNKEFYLTLQSLKDRGPAGLFGTQIDWRGFCTGCYEKALMAVTGTTNSEAAKAVATGEQKGTASKEAVKAKNYRAFPTTPNGSKADSFICKDCQGEVRAQVKVQRFLP